MIFFLSCQWVLSRDTRHQFGSAFGDHLGSETFTDRGGIAGRSRCGHTDSWCAGNISDKCSKPQLVAVIAHSDFGKSSDRSGAACFKRGKKAALCSHSGAGVHVIHRLQKTNCRVIINAAFASKRSLPRGRKHLQGVKGFSRLIEPSKAGKTGAGEQDRIEFTILDLADPRIDIAAQRHDL